METRRGVVFQNNTPSSSGVCSILWIRWTILEPDACPSKDKGHKPRVQAGFSLKGVTFHDWKEETLEIRWNPSNSTETGMRGDTLLLWDSPFGSLLWVIYQCLGGPSKRLDQRCPLSLKSNRKEETAVKRHQSENKIKLFYEPDYLILCSSLDLYSFYCL